MDILAATNNDNKLREIRAVMADTCRIVSLRQAGIESDPEETGETFEENARIKARSGMKLSGMPCIADDSGLQVSALGGEPGIRSARYAGGHGDDGANNRLLLQNLRGAADRSARYVCVICLALPDGREFISQGTCEGSILLEPVGRSGFGYDPLFLCPEYGRSYAQITPEEKNRISHRAKALQGIKKIIDELGRGQARGSDGKGGGI